MRVILTIAFTLAVALTNLAGLHSATSGYPEAFPAGLSDLDREQALPITLGPAGALRGRLAQADASQLYRLEAAAGSFYVVETFNVALGPGRGTFLSVYDAEGQYLDWGTTGWGNTDRTLSVVAPASAPLYIRVTGMEGWAGEFSVRALAHFQQPGAAWGSDQEPNDWCELATPLLPDGAPTTQAIQASNSASVTHYADVDSYRFTMEPGKSYEVRVAGLTPERTGGAVNVRLLDMASGEFVSAQAHIRVAGGVASLVHRSEQSGEACTRVAGVSLPSAWSGTYTIRLCEGRCAETVFLPITLR